MISKKKKVFVAMSGGVDSSVTAALMKEAGHDVVGITMCFRIPQGDSKKPSCCGVQGVEDARRAAGILDIPHYTVDFDADINHFIINDFISEYLNGRTPNPCVRCNQYLKFGILHKKVMSQGADYLATGHYAKIVYNSERGCCEMKKAKDFSKDQSYFLYSMKAQILSTVLFPLGDKLKSDVRALARKYRLNTAEKPGSQDICFVPDGDYKTFIKNRVEPSVLTRGDFKDHQGNLVGEHEGILHYTIGQREKLGLALGSPVYVYRIEKKTGTVYVGPQDCLYSEGLLANQFNFLVASEFPPKGGNSNAGTKSCETVRSSFFGKDISDGPFEVHCRIRYNAPEVKGFLRYLGDDRVQVDFDEPQKSVTPGQSIVFYHDDVVLGGAVIESPMSREVDYQTKGIESYGH